MTPKLGRRPIPIPFEALHEVHHGAAIHSTARKYGISKATLSRRCATNSIKAAQKMKKNVSKFACEGVKEKSE